MDLLKQWTSIFFVTWMMESTLVYTIGGFQILTFS
jgi:hypothetical protein